MATLKGRAAGQAAGRLWRSRTGRGGRPELGPALGIWLNAALGEELGAVLGAVLGPRREPAFGEELGSEAGEALGRVLGDELGDKLGVELSSRRWESRFGESCDPYPIPFEKHTIRYHRVQIRSL